MNILVIKVGALGDVLRTSFIAQALKYKYFKKNPKIYWVTSNKARPLFLNNPYIYSIVSDKDKIHLKDIHFDLVINLEEDIENCIFAKSFNSKEFIGFYASNGKILPTPTITEWFNMSALGKKPQNDILKKQNEKTHRQIMSEIININNYKKYEPFLRLTKSQRKFANNFLRRYNLSPSDLIIGVNTGAADRWPKSLSIEKTVELMDRIIQKYPNSKILLFGGPNEVERNKKILSLVKYPIIITGEGNNLIEFPSLISVCKLFITTDTLGLHIALALKRKTIVLIGPTSSNEIGMYSLGEKIISDSNCICCYKKDCKSMEKIDLKKVISAIDKTLNQKITILITAYKEPNIRAAIKSALNQKTSYDYKIIVSAPDEGTINIVKEYSKKESRLSFFKDPGKGKSYALNMIFSKIKTDILILTDGDVHISENCVEDISNSFLNPEIGCVSGRPYPQEKRDNKYGYWSNFLFDAANKIRKSAYKNNSFIECTGYLFAFRKNKITNIPLDVAEDAVIPYIFWAKGYLIGYIDSAKVYVKNASNLKDWIKQKIRTHKAHRNLSKYVDTITTPKIKSFKTESKGVFWLLKYPRNIKELFWTIELAFFRLYSWLIYALDTFILKEYYSDAWQRIESTK